MPWRTLCLSVLGVLCAAPAVRAQQAPPGASAADASPPAVQADAVADTVADPDADTDSDAGSDPDSGADPVADTDADSGSDPDPDTDTDTDADADSGSDPGSGSDSDSDPDPHSDADSDARDDPGHIPLFGKEFLPDKPRTGWAALPIAVYAPETSLGIGAFGSIFFRMGGASAQTRPSSMSLVGLYTLRDQLIVEAIPELYWDDEQWHLWSRVDYRKYPNRLWAVGNRAPDRSEERYQEDRPRWQLRLGYAVVGKLYVYGHLEALHMEIEDVEPGGLLETGQLPGSAGGRAVGIGPGIAWDTRDHLLVPRSGFFHEVVLMSYQPAFGSGYRFNVLRLNLRRYIGITDEHVLALQYYAQLQQGEPPFYMLAQLGGQNLLRGYFEGRYRDKTLMAIQAEYRLPLFWRFGAVAHAAIGDVAASVPAFGLSTPQWSAGAGLRIMLNSAEKLNLRADLGFGYDTVGFYVGIAEAF